MLNRFAGDFWESPSELAAFAEKVRINGSGVVELFAKRKDGSTFPAEIFSSVTLDDRGQPIGIVASCRDLTARHAAEAQLRESEERLKAIVESAAEGINTMSLDGVVTFVSPAWPRMMGYDVSEVVGHSFLTLVHPDDVETCRTAMDRAIATGERQRASYRVRHKDGSLRWRQMSGSSVKDAQGRPAYLVGVVEDITERMRGTRVAGLRQVLGGGRSDDSRGQRGGRSGQSRQERVPGEHESRDSHADDRDPGICRSPGKLRRQRGNRRNRSGLSNATASISWPSSTTFSIYGDRVGESVRPLLELSPGQIAAEVVALMKVHAPTRRDCR